MGDTFSMKVTADVQVMGMEANFSAKVHEKVVKVESNGNYAVESTQTEGKVKFGDQEMDAPAGGATTTRYSAAGEVLDITGDDVSVDAFRLANMTAMSVPDQAFKIGDKFNWDVKPTDKNGNTKGSGTVEVVGKEMVGSWESIKLKVMFKEGVGSEPAEVTGFVWQSTKDGSMVKFEGEYKNAPFPGAPGPINAKFKLERI